MSESTPSHSTIRTRAAEELKRYVAISAYLFVCFGVVMLYDASQSPLRSASWTALAVALGKALVIGKFILIGEALGAGTRLNAPTLLQRVAWRTLAMLAVLLILKLLEELIVGLVHGKDLAAIAGALSQEPWLSLLAPVLLMILILIPLITATEIDRALGSARLRGVLLGRAP